MPRSVTVLGDPEPESVVLSWLNPINLGSPVFTLFNVFIYTTTEGISNITRQVCLKYHVTDRFPLTLVRTVDKKSGAIFNDKHKTT